MSRAARIVRRPRRRPEEKSLGPYLVGVDIGGTSTDRVVLDRKGAITATKTASTPGNFPAGILHALRVAGERLGLPFDEG